LRAALAAAKAGDTIGFALPNPSTIQLSSGSLTVGTAVSILGPGPTSLTIQGTGQFADFLVQASSTISGLTISGGGGSSGGGIINDSTLNLTNCVVANNHVTGEGGGIENAGTIVITNCRITQNTCVTLGGGIHAGFNDTTTIIGSRIDINAVHAAGVTNAFGGGLYNDGFLSLINTSVANNDAFGVNGSGTTPGSNAEGGGIFSDVSGSFTMMNCTFNQNYAQGGLGVEADGGAALGGAIRFSGTGSFTNCTFQGNLAFGGASGDLTAGDGFGGAIEWVGSAAPTLVNCTIDGNRASQGSGPGAGAVSDGGGIATNSNGTLENTIVAQNLASSSGPDISGNLTTALYDLVGDGTGTNLLLDDTGNQVGSPGSPLNPQLGLLQNNGGPTPTMLPLPNSTAIDRGNNFFLQTTIDQRGLPRVVNGTVDIGAVEFQPLHFVTVAADSGHAPEVKVFDTSTGALRFDFNAYESTFTGGVRVAVADVNGDGIPDIITAPGLGHTPEIRVFDGATGSVIEDFMAYDPRFRGGVFVAAGDIYGTGKAAIVTGPDLSGGPDIRVFKSGNVSGNPDAEFFAYDFRFTGGVRVAVGNFDGSMDIVTAPGLNSGPDIRIFNAQSEVKIGEFLAYDFRYFGGEFVSTGDVNGDGQTDLITGTNGNGGPETRAFDGRTVLNNPTPSVVDDFMAYNPAFNGGVRVALLDVNGDGKTDIITGAGPSGGPHVRIFDGGTGLQLQNSALDSFMAFDIEFSGGVFVGAG
jgi:hypothetical protein